MKLRNYQQKDLQVTEAAFSWEQEKGIEGEEDGEPMASAMLIGWMVTGRE